MGKLKRKLTRLKGRVVEPWSDAAGDRHSEAKAHIEAETGRVPDEREIEQVKHEIKVERGDISPRRTRRRARTRNRRY